MVFSTVKQKCWLVLVLMLAWGNSNLIARWLEVPDLERGLVLAVGFIVAGLILMLKPE